MSFDFGKFVQKSTRGLFAFIVVIMVVPLVMWGYMGGEPEREEDKGSAGVIFGTIQVSKGDFNRHRERAQASWWWKKLNDPMQRYMMQFRRPEPPKPDELSKQAWEDIVLLEEARQLGLQGSEIESRRKLQEIYGMFARGYEYKDEIRDSIAGQVFHVSPSAFMKWIDDIVVIEKLLGLVEESEFADYADVYKQLLRGQQYAKVWAATFDPKEHQRDVRPPRTDEIAAFYEKNKAKYKIPAKVQVAFLLAESEELKKAVPEPTADEVKKYFEDHKAEFSKPRDPVPPGQEAPPVEARSFDDVKAEIPAKIRQREADRKAAEVMGKVDVDLGAMAAAANGKYPPDAFDQLKAKFKAKGVELLYDVTTAFDSKQVEDVEKTVGTGTPLASWPFDPATPEGDIYSQKVKTSKGVALFRLQKKLDAKDAGVTDRIREAIVKDLQKEQIRKKTQQLATNVVQEITTNGMQSARAKYPLDWRLSRYFRVGGQDTGLDDAALSQAISGRISQGQLTAGKAEVIQGSAMRGAKDKADWAYVVYVEDVSAGAPEDVSDQFSKTRKNVDEEARRRLRETYIDDRRKEANLQIDPSLKIEKESTNPLTPAP